MKKIGCGTYGNVFYDKKSREAIKKCYHEEGGDIWAGNIREMDILKRCGNHPNIVKLNRVVISKEHDEEHNKLALHLEYYKTNLQDYIGTFREGRVDISIIRTVIVQILLGLEYLHANKIIHRDLKPDNILINPDTLEIALCDFGMSEMLMKYRKCDTKVTAPFYRAPEVFKEQKYSAEVDLWAVGLILFTMIHGKSPYVYPCDEETQILNDIHDLDPNKDEREIVHLKARLKKIVLDEISKIDVKKSFSSKYLFRKLLDGLLKEDPNKRFTATQALEDSFFDPVRTTYIIPTRASFPPSPIKLRKIHIEDIPERKWINKYTMKYVSANSDLECGNLYPVVFHGLDIFEKYLNHCKEEGLLCDKTRGKYLHESEVYLYLYTCFYLAHKFYAITEIPLDYEEFYPDDLLDSTNMERAEEFEEFMIMRILGCKFFEYTLYEIAEEMINNPDASDYYKILKEYLLITQKTQSYNSYRSLYREHIMQKSRL